MAVQAPLAYSPDDAAEVLGLGRTKTFGLIRTGELQSIKVGARRLVTRDALQAFVDGKVAEIGSITFAPST